jgi:hypothetical protein
MRAYARKHGINEHTLASWNTRLRGHPDLAPDFVRVAVAEVVAAEVDPPTAHAPLRLHLGCVSVDVDHRSDLALLRRIVEALS